RRTRRKPETRGQALAGASCVPAFDPYLFRPFFVSFVCFVVDLEQAPPQRLVVDAQPPAPRLRYARAGWGRNVRQVVFSLDRPRDTRDDFVTAGGKGAPPGPAAAAPRRSGYRGGDGLHTGSAYHGEGAGGWLDRTGDGQTRWGPRRGFVRRSYDDQLGRGLRRPPVLGWSAELQVQRR